MAGDAVWLDVLPAMGGFAKDLVAGSTKAAADAGKASGKAWSGAFSGAAGTSGTKTIVDELETAKKRTEKIVAEETQAIAKARAAQSDAAAKVVLAEQALADARGKYGEDSARATAAELRLTAARDRQEAAAAKTLSVEDRLVAAKREHREVTQQLDKATGDLEAETSKQTTAWGSVRDSLGRAKDGAKDLVGGLGDLVVKAAAVAGAAALVASAWSGALELDAGVDKVTASLDLTVAQSQTAGEVAGSLYADAYGESLGDVSSAVGSVMSSIAGMRDASQADLEQVTAAALDVARAFDMDVSEATRNAGILMQTGLATDATHAFDLITASLQRVPEALRGEVTDATQEYSQYFATLGLTGEQAMGLLVDASANGQYAIDKTGDALKELTIRATDMSASSVSAYEAAGLSAEDMSARFLAGGDVAAGALSELVAGLQGIEDPTLRANSAIALFGTPLEDIGTDKIPAFLDSLAGVDAGIGDVSGKAADMGDTLNGNVTTGLESLKRGFMGVLMDGVEPLLGPAEQILGWIEENPAALQVFGIALAALATGWGVYTAAQWAANSAMLASPITWIVAGIVAVGAAVWALVENWDSVVAWIKEIWEPIGDWFAGVWQGFLDIVEPVIVWFQENVAPVFAAVWDGIKTAADVAWTVLEVIFVSILTAWQLMADGFTWVWDTLLSPVWKAVKVGAQAMWDWLNRWVFAPMKLGWELLGAGFARVKDNVFVPVWNALLQAGVNVWTWLDKWVFTPMKVGWNLVGQGFAWVKDNLITPAWNAVQTVLSAGWNWIDTYVFAPIKKGVEAVGAVFETTKDLISGAWDKVKEAAAKPVNFIIETVYTNGIKKTWDSIASKVGLDLKLPVVNPIRFADGGEHHDAQIAPAGAWRVWAEPETGGEAYIPLAPAKRSRSTSILANVAERFGYELAPRVHFANGGVWGNITGWAGDAWDAVARGASAAWNWAGDAAESVAKFLKDPVTALADLITKPMNAVLAGIGAGELGTIVSELPRKAVSGLVETVKGLVTRKNEESSAAAPGAPGALGVARMSQIVRDLLPWARVTSGFRPGAITATGYPSMHGQGRAIDIAGVGSMDTVGMAQIFRTLRTAYPNSYELIYSPMGAQQLFKGKSYVFPEPTKSMHYNHVHWAMENGGILPSVDPVRYAFADSGAVLQPGFTLVENRLGRPETVLNMSPAEISEALARMAEGNSGGDTYDLTVNNHERPVTPQTLVAAVGQVRLKNPRRNG